MQKEITLRCPNFSGTNIVKSAQKCYQVKNYQCKDCQRQFIVYLVLRYKGYNSNLYYKIELILVRNVGISDISEIEHLSIGTAFSVLKKSNKVITP